MDETHCVSDQDRLAARQLSPAGGGIQRGEELVRYENSSVGQLVEQCGFAGICVSDQGYDGNLRVAASGSVPTTVGSQLLYFALQMVNAPADLPFINFQLRLAGSTQADPACRARAPRSTAGLPGQVRPGSG